MNFCQIAKEDFLFIFIVNIVHVVELLNYYTNHCTYITFTH